MYRQIFCYWQNSHIQLYTVREIAAGHVFMGTGNLRHTYMTGSTYLERILMLSS